MYKTKISLFKSLFKSKDVPYLLNLDQVFKRIKEGKSKHIIDNLKEGFKLFGKQMKGYLTNDAVIHAPESRTSSPVRIPRDYKTLEHIEISGLYPCGEGAGYAGGIVSAAIDGQKCAIKCVESFKML